MSESSRDEWLTVQEVTQLLKMPEKSVRRWIRGVDLPAIVHSSAKGGYRIPRADYDPFVEEIFGTTGKTASAANSRGGYSVSSHPA